MTKRSHFTKLIISSKWILSKSRTIYHVDSDSISTSPTPTPETTIVFIISKALDFVESKTLSSAKKKKNS